MMPWRNAPDAGPTAVPEYHVTHMADGSETADEELARRVQKGDAEALGTLMRRYEPKLSRYGSRFLGDPDEVASAVQDALVRAYENIQGYDPGQRFSPWMYRIAHNVFVSELRKRSSRPALLPDFDTLLTHVPASEEATRDAEERETREQVERGLGALDPKYREVLVLFYLEELSYRDIADVLRVPAGTVAARLSRAKAALKKAYEALDLRP